MPSLSIEIDDAEYKHIEEVLRYVPNGARIAASHALNRTAATGKTELSRKISALMTANKTSVDKRISIIKATRDRLEASIKLRGTYGVSLIGFGARQTSTGVTAKVLGQVEQFPHDFIATGIGGVKQVFSRSGPKRIMTKGRYAGKMKQPINVIRGPDVVETFNKTPGLANSENTALNEILPKNLASQVHYLLERGKPDSE